MENYALELRNITKTYPGVVALDKVSLGLKKGEIHALVGENGAGKSTLIKVISGAIAPDEGKIVVEGKEYERMTPALSKSLGIEVIYQEFNLIPNLSIAENMFMGDFIGGKMTVDFKEMEEKAAQVFEMMKIPMNPKTLVKDLSVAYMQMVEIAKAIVKNVKILIMDEPTAPLTEDEVDILLELVEKLRKDGVTIIYVSHRMEEIYRISDRLSIFRDGQWIATHNTKEISRQKLVCEMVGREITEKFPERKNDPGEVVLEVKHLTGKGARDINFSLRKGEILGLGGLVGAGRTETARMIFGADPMESGQIIVHGKEVSIHSPKDAVANGICLVPEDRKQQGVILSLPIRDNITLPIIKSVSNAGVVDRKTENKILEKHKNDLRIKTPSFAQKVGNLSGGNQQKVFLARWLNTDAEILLLDNPTQGIDVGAKAEIYKLILELAKQGKTILINTLEIPEIQKVADYCAVFYNGEIIKILEHQEIDEMTVMMYSTNAAQAEEGK